MRTADLSPEFVLLAACCRWPSSEERDARIVAAAAAVEWRRFCVVARKHRVEGLVWKALRAASVSVPEQAARRLAEAAGSIARDNLLAAAESLRLAALFDAAGLDLLFVKGLTLGKLAYGEIGLKRGWDIDVLIPPASLDRSAALLGEAGYACITPASPDLAGLARWHRGSKESVWRHARTGLHVELHTALVDNPRLLSGVGIDASRQLVEILPGRALPTLANEELFAYLCVHGASSAWFRLKWLADLAAFIAVDAQRSDGTQEVTRLYRRSHELGAGRAAAQALLLCSWLLGTLLPQSLRSELESDGLNRWLAEAALALMAGRHEAVELHERRLATAPIHLTQIALLPGRAYALSEVRRQLRHLARAARPSGRGRETVAD